MFVLRINREAQSPELLLLHLSELRTQPPDIQITQHLSPPLFMHMLYLKEKRERIKSIASR